METRDNEHIWPAADPLLQIISAKWTVSIILILLDSYKRPAELARLLPGINPKILTERLRDLEQFGLIDRKEYKEIPPKVEYSLTLRGRELLQAISPIRELSERWTNISTCRVKESAESQNYIDNANGNIQTGHGADNISDQNRTAKVYLVGIGPGVNDLITLRATKILSQADVIIYSASRIQDSAFDHCSPNADLINLDTFTFEEQMEHYLYIKEKALVAARLYSGDPVIFASINEQIEMLNKLNIEYEVIPGIASFTAAAASVGCSLTQVPACESIIITNLPARAKSPRPGQPKKEDLDKLERLAVHNTSLCIYLYGSQVSDAVQTLSKHYPPKTPVALVSGPQRLDERKYIGTLESIGGEINASDWDWRDSAIMLVGDVLQSVFNQRELALGVQA